MDNLLSQPHPLQNPAYTYEWSYFSSQSYQRPYNNEKAYLFKPNIKVDELLVNVKNFRIYKQ